MGVTRASVSAVVIAVAIVGASVTLRPHGHTANKKMTLASTSWDYDNVDFLTISEDFVILRGLLQDHGQDNNAGRRRRRLHVWFQIFTIGNLSPLICVSVVNMQLLVMEG